MSLRKIECPGSGSVAPAIPSGKNPKVTCFRCSKRVGIIKSSGKVKKHMVLARMQGKKTTVLSVR